MTIEITTFVNDSGVSTTTTVNIGEEPISAAEENAFRMALERVLQAFKSK